VVSDAVATQEPHVTNIRRLLGGYAVAPEQRKPLETRFALLLAEHDEFFNSDKLEGWRGFAREVQVQRFNTGHNMLADGGVMSAIKVLCEQWGRPL
jgi:surfactin synthase thioesterase subunit